MALALPEGYYLDNFQKLLLFVHEQYQDLLTPQEQSFYLDFQALSPQEQCLYVRLISRKGPYFRSDKLHYPEIPNVHETLQGLAQAGFVSLNPKANPSWLLNLLVRQELLQLPVQTPLERTLKKQALVEHFLTHEPLENWLEAVEAWFAWAEPLRLEELCVYRLCFFGNLHQDLTEFVLLDLGMIRYEAYSIHPKDRYFQNRLLLDQTFQLLQMRFLMEAFLTCGDAQTLVAFGQILPKPLADPTFTRRHGHMVNALARQLERLGALEEALALYEQTAIPPSRERQARILAKQNKPQEALKICNRLLNEPFTEEEREFAESFGHRLKKKLGHAVALPKPFHIQEETLHLPNPALAQDISGKPLRPKDSVELQAAAHFRAQGHGAFYGENQLWNGLFGLAFWDILFMPLRGAFFNSYQRGPHGLFSHDFRLQRQAAIEARLRRIEEEEAWPSEIVATFHKKQGTSNYFVHWPFWNEALLHLCLERIPRRHLACVFDRLSHDLQNNRSGFPDLIVFCETGYELVEIKAPGDRLQKNQKRWMEYFHEWGIPHRLVHVIPFER